MGEVDCCCPTFVAGFLVSIQRDMSVPLLITLAPFLSLDYIIIVSSWPVIDLQVMNESHGGIDAASIKRGPCSTTSTFARDNKRTKYTNHDDNGVCPTLVNVAIHPNGEATQGTPVATARDSAALTDTTNNSQGGTATRGAQHKVATIEDDTTRVSLCVKVMRLFRQQKARLYQSHQPRMIIASSNQRQSRSRTLVTKHCVRFRIMSRFPFSVEKKQARNENREIAKQVVKIWHEGGGRFLERDATSGQWVPLLDLDIVIPKLELVLKGEYRK